MTTERLNYASAGAVRTRKDQFRVRVEEDTNGSWTVTEHRRSGATLLFRGDHSDATKFANQYVNG